MYMDEQRWFPLLWEAVRIFMFAQSWLICIGIALGGGFAIGILSVKRKAPITEAIMFGLVAMLLCSSLGIIYNLFYFRCLMKGVWNPYIIEPSDVVFFLIAAITGVLAGLLAIRKNIGSLKALLISVLLFFIVWLSRFVSNIHLPLLLNMTLGILLGVLWASFGYTKGFGLFKSSILGLIMFSFVFGSFLLLPLFQPPQLEFDFLHSIVNQPVDFLLKCFPLLIVPSVVLEFTFIYFSLQYIDDLVRNDAG